MSTALDAAEPPVTVYVVEEIELFRTGLEMILVSRGLDVRGASDARSALARIPVLKPCVIVLRDLDLVPQITGKHPDAAFLALTTGAGALAALEAGVDGVADTGVSVENLVLAVATLAAGHTWMDSAAAAQMRLSLASAVPTGPLAALTKVERDVADLLAQGLSNREISEQLFIAEKTAKNYVSRILRALGVDNRAQAGLAMRDLTAGSPGAPGASGGG